MPLLVVGSAQVRIERIENGNIRIGKRGCGKTLRQDVEIRNGTINPIWIRRRLSAAGIERLQREEGRIEARAGIRERTVFLSAVEDAIARAQDQLVSESISHSDAGCEVVQVGIDQSTRSDALKRNAGGNGRRELGF